MKRLWTGAAGIAILISGALAAPAQAGVPAKDPGTNVSTLCDSLYETRQREIPPGSGNFVPFTAYWVPLRYPDGTVEDLPVLNKAGCITTVLAGGGQVPVPYDALSTSAINAQCKYLEDNGVDYPYRFYGREAYEAKNRADCVYFLRSFHLGLLPPGPA